MTNLTKKSEDISGWYNDIIAQAKLADHGPSKGSIIIRPYGYAIWENIQKFLDTKIKSLGAENAYFPLFIPMSFLEKETEHVEGFSPELAVVTHAGGEKLVEPLVVRPTSETIIYDAFSKWVSSYRDLPLIINQWANVVRWEKRPYLFLRTTEFLWQEGHSAHSTEDEAKKLVKDALDMYISTYQDELSLFGYSGRKSETEKFAGAKETYTYEMLMPDGKVVQGCTSHNLAQNFSKVFKVQFQDSEKKLEYAYQTSWGFSTRSMGALFLNHGDNSGLILPPAVAPIQAVIIPIISKNADAEEIKKLSQKIYEVLESLNIRTKLDDTDNSPGWKFNEYELKGVPIRIEIGATEAREKVFRVQRRDTKEFMEISFNNIGFEVNQILESMQKDILEAHKKFTLENTHLAETYSEFKDIMKNQRGFIKAFWCEDAKCESEIKDETKASTRCLQDGTPEEKGTCIKCNKVAKYRWLFAQSY